MHTPGVRTMRIRSALRRGGTHTHTHTQTRRHTLTITPTQPRTQKHTHVRIRVHVSIFHHDTHKFGFLRVTDATHNKERKMLKITFNSSNTWGRQAKSACNWPKACRGDWAVPACSWFRLSQRRWSATPPRTGSETFLAAALPRFPPRVPSQWERRLGGGKGKARRRSRPAFAGLERETPLPKREGDRTGRDSRAGDGVSEPVPGWREQACGTLHGRGRRCSLGAMIPSPFPLSDCNHGDEGAKGPALRPLIFFASLSLALSLPLTLAPCTGDIQACLASETPVG